MSLMIFAATSFKSCRAIILSLMICLGGISNSGRSDDGLTAKSLIERKCLSCHSGDDAKGKLDLASRESIFRGGESGPAIVERSAAKSLLWQRVEQNEMPPKHPLTDTEKQVIQDWIMAGAEWQGGPLNPLAASSEHRAGLDWWSLQPVRSVLIPKVETQKKRFQPIDDFVLDKLIEQKLSMSEEADRRVFIRRISFDLIGLPATPDEVELFVQDQSPDACERLVDRLLASPHYGERWARHWLDVIRFGESNGFERDLPRPNAWHYRDWVISALNRDLPYDEFVRWQIAGDLYEPDNPDAMKAVGFLVAGAHDTVVPVIDSMRAAMRQDELEDIVGTAGQTFLGLTTNCARCHDHKFDPISTREYYQLASALAGIDHGEREFIPEDVARELELLQSRVDKLSRTLREQAAPVEQLLLAKRTSSADAAAESAQFPTPISAWSFIHDLRDQIGELHVTLMGSAKRTSAGLVCDATSFAMTTPLTRDLTEKTLEVRLRLSTLDQAGGGAMSVQRLDGKTFDSIVYAEQERRRWVAGSNGFQRTLPFQGPLEDSADQAVVVFTQVYRADGTIEAYRNGQRYGEPIRKASAVTFEAGKSQVLFGLRHGKEAGNNKTLACTIQAARLFDHALSPTEVDLSAKSSNVGIAEADIRANLSSDQVSHREKLQQELASVKKRRADLAKNGPLHIYTVIATQPSRMKVHRRGSVLSLGEEVAPAGIAAVQGLSADFGLRADAIESHRRRKLANWIANKNNPLFVRTMVNRVWHYHFGAGLVDSPNDLGFHGGLPSHPELLEWLSLNFESFSQKRLHRMMVTSATYRQSSKFNPEAAARDASNRYLWRKSPRRLEAEEVRDAMLSIAGELNTNVGGKGYSDTKSYFTHGTQFYDPIDPPGHQSHRRTVYRMWARSGRSPFLDTFDCPDPSTTTPRRSSTVTPLQALSLLNHPFSLRMSDRFAERLSPQENVSTEQQVQWAYRLLYGRDADQEEIQLSRDFIARRGLPEFCRAMWNSSEFLFVD